MASVQMEFKSGRRDWDNWTGDLSIDEANKLCDDTIAAYVNENGFRVLFDVTRKPDHYGRVERVAHLESQSEYFVINAIWVQK